MRYVLAVLGALSLFSISAQAAPPNVVASIAPVHSLVSMIMGEIGEPYLLVRGSSSPHVYTLRPSDARALSEADLVFRVGDDLELSLVAPLETLAEKATIVTMSQNPRLSLIALNAAREGEANPWVPTGGPGEFDMHIWLDPANARIMLDEIAAALTKADPDNAGTYLKNAATARRKITDLETEILNNLVPVGNQKFIFLHDAYRYFERAFSITSAATLTASPEKLPGARKIAEIINLIRRQNVSCIFSEPQFSPRLVGAIAEATGVSSGVLDPLGAALAPGPLLYGQLLRAMARSMRDCLEKQRVLTPG